METYKAVLIVISALMVELGGGEDLYWKPNSNWGNPDNWALGRAPSCGDIASFKTAPANTVVFINTDTTLTSLSMPENGRLVLGPSVTIKLSPGVDCAVAGDTQPMAATVNEFVGANTDYWECSDNWRTIDGSAVEHAPCGTDAANFEKGSFSFVGANRSIYVRSMVVRGTVVNSLMELNSTEFKLDLEVNAKCGDNPSLCPCPDDKRCPKSKVDGNTGKQANKKKRDGIIAGVIVVVVLVAVAVLCLVVFIVTMYLRKGIPYLKEEFLNEPEKGHASNSDGKLFDNPLFDDDVKHDLGEDLHAPPPHPPHENDGEKKEKNTKKSNYQRF